MIDDLISDVISGIQALGAMVAVICGAILATVIIAVFAVKVAWPLFMWVVG